MSILSMAVEMEGSWLKSKIPKHFFQEYNPDEMSADTENAYHELMSEFNCDMPEYTRIFHTDGSVGFRTAELRELHNVEISDLVVEGELASPIFYNIKDMVKWIERFHPKGNDSCGLHIHIKPESGDYQNAVMNYGKFKDDYMNFLNHLGEKRNIPKDSRYYQRINGIRWCKNSLTLGDVKHQLIGSRYENRYRHINFCWSKHKTIEFRSFPIFKSKTLQKSVCRDIINYLETWFLICPNKAKVKEIEV
jgi:hypothetical protein